MVNVTVKDVGPCKKHLKIIIPQADVQAKVEEGYAKLGASAVISGFRKGRVPRKLLVRRFGEDVLEEVKQNLLAEASEKAIEEKGLKPIGEPSFDNVAFEEDKDCEFEVTLEVEPEFELADMKGIALTKKSAAVTAEELTKGLDNLRHQRAKLELMSQETAVEAGDLIVCDWEVKAAGEAVADQKDAELFVFGKRSGGLEFEQDLSEALKGAKFGDARELKGKVLDNYPIEKWRGKEASVAVKVKEIRRPVPPELNEEFAKSLDFDSVEALNKMVEQGLAANKGREVQLELEQQLFDALVEKMPFELPQGVLKAQARNIMMRQQYRLRQRGIPEEEIEKHLEELRNASEEAAGRNLKTYFILKKIGEKEKIFVTETEVDARIAAIAAQNRVTAQKMRAQMEEENSLSELRAGMREDKVTEFLLKNANVKQEK